MSNRIGMSSIMEPTAQERLEVFFALELGEIAAFDYVYSLASTNINQSYSLASTNINQSAPNLVTMNTSIDLT